MRRVLALTLAWVDVPRSVSVHGADPDVLVREPVPGVLIETHAGWLLLDTGYNLALLRDPALRRRFYPVPATTPHVPGPGGDPLEPGGDPLEEQLGRFGVAPEDISAVAVSHLHADHAGGLRHFAGQVPVHAQRAELEYGLSGHPEPERHEIFRIDFDDPRIDWRVADGDVEVAPGVTALSTPGHTPGHQSFSVEVDAASGGGGFVFAFDAADLAENLNQERAIGTTIGVPPEASLGPIRRLKRISAERGLRLVPGHDPQVWPALERELAARFG